MRAPASSVLLATASLAATSLAATIPDFGSKPHILMVRPSPPASPSRARAPEQPAPDVATAATAANVRRAGAALRFSSAPPSLLTRGLRHPAVRQVVVDDLGWHNVGWHNPDMITPNANKLVAEGMTCAASLAASSLVAPSCADPPPLRAGSIGHTNFGTAPRHARPS